MTLRRAIVIKQHQVIEIARTGRWRLNYETATLTHRNSEGTWFNLHFGPLRFAGWKHA